MEQNPNSNLPKVSNTKILLLVALGVGVSLYLIITTFKPGSLQKLNFSYQLLGGLILAALTVIIRDFAFMYKIRLSTGEILTWRKTLQLVIMWEFGAAVTPKLGEVAFTLYVLKKGGLSYGRSMATIMLNSFLDNLVFVVLFTVLYFLVGPKMLLVNATCADLHEDSILLKLRHLAAVAWIGYLILVAFSVFLYIAIFIVPHSTRQFFRAIAQWKIMRYIKNGLIHFGDEIEITSLEFKKKTKVFWVKMSVATLINWMARYALANALLYAFSDVSLNMLEVYARQFVLWVFLIVPSTPGATGVAELMFMAMNCEFMPAGLSAAITTVWRIYSFYIYLIAGMIVLRRWIAAKD